MSRCIHVCGHYYPKYRTSFGATPKDGEAYTCIIYGRTIDELKAKIAEKQRTEKVENVRFFKFVSDGSGDPYYGCMKEIRVRK